MRNLFIPFMRNRISSFKDAYRRLRPRPGYPACHRVDSPHSAAATQIGPQRRLAALTEKYTVLKRTSHCCVSTQLRDDDITTEGREV